MEITKFKIIQKDKRDHYFYEVKENIDSDPLWFVFDINDKEYCYLFSDLNGEWVKIKQNRDYYKKYIDFIKNYELKPKRISLNYKCINCGGYLPEDTMTNLCESCENKLMNSEEIGIPEIKTIHLNDFLSHSFNKNISKQIYNIANLKNKKCQFCNGKFDKTAHYYKHEGGYQTNIYFEKIWIWFECLKCNHQWSLTHLKLNRNYRININP